MRPGSVFGLTTLGLVSRTSMDDRLGDGPPLWEGEQQFHAFLGYALLTAMAAACAALRLGARGAKVLKLLRGVALALARGVASNPAIIEGAGHACYMGGHDAAFHAAVLGLVRRVKAADGYHVATW